MTQKNEQNLELTLSNVFESIGTANRKTFVYLSGSDFYQVASRPTWIMALLTPDLLDSISQDSGLINSSEASNLTNKTIGANSHRIDKKLEDLYCKFTRNDFYSVLKEEQHIGIALSRCAIVKNLGISDSFEATRTQQGRKVKASLRKLLTAVVDTTAEGRDFAEELKTYLIEALYYPIGKQCLLQSDKEIDKDTIASIDPFKLFTAVIVTSLNIRNTPDTMDTQTEYSILDEADELSLFIKNYLMEDHAAQYKEENPPENCKSNTKDTDINTKPKSASGLVANQNGEIHKNRKEQTNDLELLIRNEIIQATNTLDIDTETYDISLLIEKYFLTLISNAKKEGIQSFDEFKDKVESISEEIRQKILKLQEKILPTDDLADLKISSLDFLYVFLLFRVAQALFEFSEHLFKKATDDRKKEELRLISMRFKNRRDKYKRDTELAQDRMDDILNDALGRDDLNNALT